jgi:hypothetical protein
MCFSRLDECAQKSPHQPYGSCPPDSFNVEGVAAEKPPAASGTKEADRSAGCARLLFMPAARLFHFARRDEARRIASNIAKLPELVGK